MAKCAVLSWMAFWRRKNGCYQVKNEGSMNKYGLSFFKNTKKDMLSYIIDLSRRHIVIKKT